jgi:hypothetical protein
MEGCLCAQQNHRLAQATERIGALEAQVQSLFDVVKDLLPRHEFKTHHKAIVRQVESTAAAVAQLQDATQLPDELVR